jgi:hypothetical protein
LLKIALNLMLEKLGGLALCAGQMALCAIPLVVPGWKPSDFGAVRERDVYKRVFCFQQPSERAVREKI